MAKQCSICGKQFGRFESSDGIFGVLDMCGQCISEVKKVSALANAKDYKGYLSARNTFLEKYKQSVLTETLINNMDSAYDIKGWAASIADAQKKEQEANEEYLRLLPIRDFPVTTANISAPYDIIGPVMVNTTNKGIFRSAFSKLLAKYANYPMNTLLKMPSTDSEYSGELGTFLLSIIDGAIGFEGIVGQRAFDIAYYICVAELKLRCAEMGGDAIVGMHMDFDLDTSNFAAFYIQMHGTAVKLKNN